MRLSKRRTKTIPDSELAICYPWEGKQFLTELPKEKLSMENVYGYAEKNKRIEHDGSRSEYGLTKLKVGSTKSI